MSGLWLTKIVIRTVQAVIDGLAMFRRAADMNKKP